MRTGCNGTQTIIFFRFSSVWKDIEELWFISVKELIRAARMDARVCNYVMNSRLPSKIDLLLSCKNIDKEIAECYHLFNAFIKTTASTS